MDFRCSVFCILYYFCQQSADCTTKLSQKHNIRRYLANRSIIDYCNAINNNKPTLYLNTKEHNTDQIKMGCCCSKSKFEGEGHRLGTADEATAAAQRSKSSGTSPTSQYQPYTDKRLTDEERARIREERLAAAESRLSKEVKKEMKTKKKKPASDEPLRGPNSQNTMRWTAG